MLHWLTDKLWPCIAEPTEQHPGSRDFDDGDEEAPPHFNDPSSYEPDEDDE